MADSPNPAGPPPAGSGPVYFDRSAAERIRDSTVYVERMVRGGTPPPRRGSPGAVLAFALARTTSIIGKAGSGGFGSGSAVIQEDNGSGGLVNGPGPAVSVRSYHTDKQIASGSLVAIAWFANAWWAIDVDDCAHLI